MTKEEILALIRKYNEQQCTEEEAALLESWYVQQDALHQQQLSPEKIAADLEDVYLSLPKPSRRVPVWKMAAAAAVIGIAFFSGWYFINKSPAPASSVTTSVTADIEPGGNRATLTLSDGTVIDLDDAKQGKLTEQTGSAVSKTADDQLVYTAASAGSAHTIAYNTIRTPNGGQYVVVLPDASKVWLNAASELTFPVSFTSTGNRQVKLKGEAYFEITKDAQRPFMVSTEKQDVKVLGTKFSVNAYLDEPGTKTTLVEGSVQVIAKADRHSILLKPNDQVLLKDNFTVNKVDGNAEIAWTKGKFTFNEEPLASIMRKLARWYNLEVEFKDPEAAKTSFGGTVSRFDKVSKVLRKLEATGDVRFEITQTNDKDYKVVVYKK